MHEVVGATSVSMVDKPAWNQFGFGIESSPCPNVASAFSRNSKFKLTH